ncbi:ribosome maturation factor RimP [Pseudanabaena biceps]|nr:ribosome maturation factor RimP [Pseudanabaena biceps]
MSHPLIPQILQIAEEAASPLGLEVVDAVLYTNKNPVVLRVDIRNPDQNTGLDDCEKMSRALEPSLDEANLIPHAYVLEISSPGADRQIQGDREFIAFKGFMVNVVANQPHDGKQSWIGHLVSRSETHITISIKGRIVNIPRDVVERVELAKAEETTVA